MNLDGNVLSFAYLESGFLVFGCQIMTIWRTDCWPFERMQRQATFKEPANSLLALSAHIFARVSDQTVSIWDSDLKLLHEIKINQYYCELKAMGNDVLMINKSPYNFHSKDCNVLFFNFRSGELLDEFRVTFETCYLFETPDKEFLVMAGKEMILFYHLKGGYVYSQFETTQRHQFQNDRVKILKN